MSAQEPTGVSDFQVVCPTMAEILRAVRSETSVSVLDILSERRDNLSARPRQIFCWAARHTTLHSLPEIGHYIRLDHTTVMYAVRRIEALRKSDPEIFNVTEAVLYRVAPPPEERERRLELVRQRMRA